MTGELGLVAGGTAIFGALAIALVVLLVPERRVTRLAPHGSGGTRAQAKASLHLGDLARRAGEVADRALEQRNRRASLDRVLEEAGLSIRAGEALAAAAGTAGLGLALGTALGGPLVGVGFAGLVLYGAWAYVGFARSRRRARFAEQLVDLLQLLAGSLRAGYGFLQALETAAQETESPTSAELRRVTAEVRLGRDVAEALGAMSVRLANEDFEWVVQAVAINREVGGDLAEVLDSVGVTVRARFHLARQVQALSAEGRMSAYVLMAIPPGLAALMTVVNPAYIALLATTGMGRVMSVVGVAFLAIGALWMRRLVRPVY